ncbi:hypothetical protein [Zhongshania arctica]|uniref:Lipoprotein n=1 Tax=Zhongshania arctica TaxID=3238302 RepID=A0ABV3TZ15_9GAMM
MDSSIISGLIGGVASVALCTYISKRVRTSQSVGKLKFGSFLVILAWCCLAFVGIAVWAFFNNADAWEKPSELYSIIGLFVGFGFASVYCFGEYFKVSGNFDTNGIDFTSPWTGRKVESWENLESIKFNSQANWYVLYFKSGKKIRLSSLLSGHGEVLEMLESKGFNF